MMPYGEDYTCGHGEAPGDCPAAGCNHNPDTGWMTALDARRDAEQDEQDAPRSWRPVDPEPFLSGTWTAPAATVGARADGQGVLYPGRIHTVAGESEAGKGWLCVTLALTELSAGRAVLVLDFEDEPGTWYGRLLAAGAKRDQLRERFAYVRPETPIGSVRSLNRGDVGQVLADLQPSLAVIDGVTESMVLHGLDPLSNKDAATFGRMLPRWVAQHGPAVCALDHVTKNGERGRYALGAVHKLNAVDGAAYVLDNVRPFGVGVTGRSRLLLAKDRPGALRQHALPSSGGLHWFADLVMASTAAEFVETELTAPVRAAGAFRPSVLMARVCEALTKAGTPLSGRGIEDRVRGHAKDIRAAVAVLVDEGYVAVVDGPNRAKLHRLVKPFQPSGED